MHRQYVMASIEPLRLSLVRGLCLFGFLIMKGEGNGCGGGRKTLVFKRADGCGLLQAMAQVLKVEMV
jgi:hypothetical protein